MSNLWDIPDAETLIMICKNNKGMAGFLTRGREYVVRTTRFPDMLEIVNDRGDLWLTHRARFKTKENV